MNATLSVPSGEINIVSNPPGAEVTIDGRVMGASPVRATVRAGQHTYTARLPGRQPEEGTFTMEEGRILTKRITWSEEPAGPSGVVEVRTIPPGATGSADGAPLSDKTPTNLRLTVGRHTLTLSLSGFEVAEREIDVPADDSTPVKVYVTLSRQ
jgi:hypothetical protein